MEHRFLLCLQKSPSHPPLLRIEPQPQNEDVIKRVKEKQDRYQRRRLETGPTQT
jgi:hypothetical protein